MTTNTATATTPPAVRPSCDARTGVIAGSHGFDPLACNTLIGLRSFVDGQGKRRHYCGAPGHRESAVARFGESMYEGMD